MVEEKSRTSGLNESLSQKNENPIVTRFKKNGKKINRNYMVKRPKFLKAGKKSIIDIRNNLVRTPVVYSSLDGKDYFIYIKAKSEQHQPQTIPFAPQMTTYIPAAPSLPSKTFLVTVYGQQLEGIEDKLRRALSTPLETTTRSCECACCPCACSSPKLQNELDCSCEKPAPCPCETDTTEQANDKNPKGVYTLMIFPTAGQSLGHSACVCPCCACSCSEPGHENYECGCQKSPPVLCPCTVTSNNEIQPQSSSVGYSTNNCPCEPSSPAPCSCAVNASPAPGTNNVAPTENQLTPWTGEPSSTYSCSCPCCPCACSQPTPYPSDYCGCANNPATPCPCANDAVSYS